MEDLYLNTAHKYGTIKYALTQAQIQELEATQKRAIHTIFQFSRGMSYCNMLFTSNLTSLASRRDNLSRKFFLNITNPASCLHHFLPQPRSNSVTSRLRIIRILPKTLHPHKMLLFIHTIWPFSLPA